VQPTQKSSLNKKHAEDKRNARYADEKRKHTKAADAVSRALEGTYGAGEGACESAEAGKEGDECESDGAEQGFDAFDDARSLVHLGILERAEARPFVHALGPRAKHCISPATLPLMPRPAAPRLVVAAADLVATPPLKWSALAADRRAWQQRIGVPPPCPRPATTLISGKWRELFDGPT
jgi:hypothetical protein